MTGSKTCTATFNTNPPGAFTLNAASTSCSGVSSQVQLTWTASTGATSYDVYRTPGGAPYATGVNSGWTDTSVTPGTSYTYFIRAKNAGGTTDSNTINPTALYCAGNLTVNATLNGSA